MFPWGDDYVGSSLNVYRCWKNHKFLWAEGEHSVPMQTSYRRNFSKLRGIRVTVSKEWSLADLDELEQAMLAQGWGTLNLCGWKAHGIQARINEMVTGRRRLGDNDTGILMREAQ